MSTSLNGLGEDETTGTVQVLASLADIEEGGFTEAQATIDGDVASVILHRSGERVRAWHNVCPHAGRRLDWSPGRFLKSKEGLLVCAVHGASFETDQGTCVAGPCRGDRLSVVAVTLQDGMVVLATTPGSQRSGL